ncbi:Pecanex-like protein 1 [Oopsacas minuta]|uniref:Pecanex-like protein n=1 Tax=Oopsacas minuta TaxID=111878 RepID=A0AAV7JNE0_9METZ|nr:Pecanex-like protein 1 [Oopsacas minuta]
MCSMSCRNRAKRFFRHLYYGPLSALTGGYLIRYKDGVYPNLTLSLIWMCLFLSPLSLYYLLFFFQPESTASAAYWTLYAVIVGTFFTGLKVTNFRLHRIFDREDAHKQKKQNQLNRLKREQEAKNKLTGVSQQGADVEDNRRETVFSEDDTVPDTEPSDDTHRPQMGRLLPEHLGSDSELSSIRLKSTTPSLQNPGRQSPSIELTIFSEPSDPKNWDINGPFDTENRQDSSDFVTPYDPVGESADDKFMTPVKLPPPGAKYSELEEPSSPSTSTPPNPFRMLMATESPYKMPPPFREKISRSQSQRELTDSGSQEEMHVPSASMPTTKSLNTFSEMQLDQSSFTVDLSKIKDNIESLLHDTANDTIGLAKDLEDPLRVHIREKPHSTEGGAEISNSLLDFELTTPEIEQAVSICEGASNLEDGGRDLLNHMSHEEMAKFIDFSFQEGGHVAVNQDDATPGATHFYRDVVDSILVAYKFGNQPGQISEKRIIVDVVPPRVPRRPTRSSSYRTRDDTSTNSSSSSMRWEPVHDSSSASPARRIETSEIEISGPPAARRRLASNRADLNRFYILPRLYIPMRLTRTQLEKYFDRDQSLIFVLYYIILSVAVSATGIAVLRIDYYHHVFVVWFCVIMASCQFSLLRTIVPDPASSVHGYNKYLAMAKAFYFSSLSVVALIVNAILTVQTNSTLIVYGFNWLNPSLTLFIRDSLLVSLLCLPAAAVWGLLPQVDTFLIYFSEKIDMYVFGGTAVVSLIAGAYALLRSIVTAVFFSAVSIFAFHIMAIQPDTRLNLMFSIVFAIIFTFSYLLSRSASSPSFLFDLFKNKCNINDVEDRDDLEIQDPVPPLIRRSVRCRLVNDLVIAILLFLAIFAIAATTVFTFDKNRVISHVLRTLTILVGVLTHYVIPQLRKKHPWMLLRNPLLRSKEYSLDHEVRKDAKIMWFERVHVWLEITERFILYPLVFLEAMVNSAYPLQSTFGNIGAGIVLSIAAMKVIRNAYCETGIQYIYLLFTYLFFQFDYPQLSNGFLLDYYVLSFLVAKVFELKYKLHFLFIYQAPWNMPWGGITHFIIQPLLIPHPGFIFLQAVLAAVASAPLSPFIASSLFLLSYVRPVKFWEKSYRTRHFDNTVGRLSSVLGMRRGPNAEHMDSIFYDHLAHSLQRVLAGEIQMGRWGLVKTGDFFIVIRDSDHITAFVHIIEIGNGFVTFQLRGCELKGTYCHNMEVRSMNDGFDIDDERCCCCKRCCRCSCPPYDNKHVFCFNAYCSSRWSGWEIINTSFVLRGYSKIENDASYIFNTHDAFRIYNTLFVKSMLYYMIKCPMFSSWIGNQSMQADIANLGEDGYSDPHPYFLDHCDIDFDKRLGAVTLARFNDQYGEWLRYCLEKRGCIEVDLKVVSVFGWALSLAGRRVLGNATQQNVDTPFSSMWNISFLHGVYALFKGDYRINCPKDEWIFADMDILRRVISPALKIALKLQQDHYLTTDEGLDSRALYHDIITTERDIVIAHEGDPQWIRAVVSDRPSLFTLRYTPHDNNKLYQFVRLNTRYLQMRLIKMNQEVIRGLWASQQQEQVYFQQDLAERASIQNLRCVARNLVNSSMDQPIGYPIYVSPLLTSYVNMNSTFNAVTGGLINPVAIVQFLYTKIRKIASKVKSSTDGNVLSPGDPRSKPETSGDNLSHGSPDSYIDRTYVTNVTDYVDPFATDSDSDFEDPFKPHHLLSRHVRITDVSVTHSNMTNLVQWPDPVYKAKANRGTWKQWNPEEGMEGKVMHVWRPFHRDSKQRSYLDKTILLLLIEDRYFVPINESGIEEV